MRLLGEHLGGDDAVAEVEHADDLAEVAREWYLQVLLLVLLLLILSPFHRTANTLHQHGYIVLMGEFDFLPHFTLEHSDLPRFSFTSLICHCLLW